MVGCKQGGVISKEAQGGKVPLAKIIVHAGGLRAPRGSCTGLAFQSVLTLLPKCFSLL